MDPLQMTTLGQYLHNDEAHSALPNAPVVPDEGGRWERARAAAAGILHRVADLVSPDAVPARPTLASAHKIGIWGNRQLRWDESPCRPSPTVSA